MRKHHLVLHALGVVARVTPLPHETLLDGGPHVGLLLAIEHETLPGAGRALPVRVGRKERLDRRILELESERGLGQQAFRLLLEVAHHRVVEDDVGVVDLSREGVAAVGAHREPGAGHDPAEEAVPHVLRIEILPLVVVGLLADDDGVAEADLLVGLVPLQDPVTHGATEPDRHRLLDVEDDRLARLAQGQAGVPLHQMPAVDIAIEEIA